MSVPTNLIPTKITGLPEYTGTSQEGYLPYVLDGRTWKVQFSQVAATSDVPPTRAINTGVGLAGGGNLTQDRTIYIANEGVGYDQLDKTGVVAGTYGDALSVPTITVDDTGRVTGLVNTTIVLPQYVPTSRSILAGTGLTGGGDLTTNRTISINFSSATPQPLGAATAGTGTQAARDDHVHPAVDLSDTTETQGVLPLVRGGSGNALSPVAGAVVYSGSGGLYLTDPGTLGQVLTSGGPGGVPTWSTVSGVGTVTSVNVSGGTSGFTFTGGPITTAGTITMQDPDYIQFDTAATVTPATGRIWFDGGYTLNVGMNANVTGHAMEDNYFYVKASSAITKGQIVMFTGTVGSSGVPTGAPAAGLGVNDGLLIMGIAAETIALNGFGLIQSFGPLRGFNTTGSAYGETWADGDLLYYNSAYAGGLTNVQPVAPGIRAPIAAVLTAGSGGSGSILIRVTPGSVLGGTDSNVYINSLSNGDILQYNSANSRWQNVAPSFGSVTSVDASGGTTGLTFSGGPITSSGTLTLGGTLGVANGGTGATTLTANAILKGNGTSAVSASSITDDGTVVTIAEQVRLSSPNTSAAAWTTSGINLIQSAATFTDTTSTGTVANVYMNRFNAQTYAASNAVTLTNIYGTFFNNPAAGANVTLTGNNWAIGADSIYVTGTISGAGGYLYLAGNGSFAHTGSTGTQTHTFASATTASGSTKNVNIGTNGASGSTTNITLGSSTSGATQTTTVNGQVTLAPIGGSAAAWTTSGIALKQSAATWTDTTSTGTIGNVYMNRFSAQTLAASNPITVPYIYGTYFSAPTAGANVTVSSAYAALGADSIIVGGYVNLGGGSSNVYLANSATTGQVQVGSTSGTGQILIGQSTASQTVNVHTGTTASGSTKTVNIGTGGASGSTTAITIGSSTSGATQTTTINGRVTLAPIGASTAAWTTSGIALTQSAATWTDTSSTGTVADVRVNNFAAQTVAASNTITATNLYGTYFTDPVAGTNVTATARYALGADSLRVAGSVNIVGGTTISGTIDARGTLSFSPTTASTNYNIGGSTQTGTIQLGRSTVSQTVEVAQGTTASGSTKTVNIGTGGASGSTTNITIGSSTSGATSTTVLNGTVGIGATTSAKFSVNTGNINLTDAYALNWGAQSTYIYGSSASGYIRLATNNVDRLTVDNVGNIAIGAASAAGTITMNGGVKPLTAAVTSSATITPTADTTNQYNVTALAVGGTFAAPSGTPVDGQKLMLRIKDNGTAQTLAWNAIYRAIGTTLPTTTTANKTIYVGCVYNSADTKWDVVAVATEA